MYKYVRLSIEEQDINGAKRADCLDCPIARAAKRQIDSARQGEVSTTQLSFFRAGYREIYMLDLDAINFIRAWDKGLDVKPCEVNADFDYRY